MTPTSIATPLKSEGGRARQKGRSGRGSEREREREKKGSSREKK